ncbi:MAG: hypothetical protein AAGA56_22710 [Myxococcota bacterium]
MTSAVHQLAPVLDAGGDEAKLLVLWWRDGEYHDVVALYPEI